MLSITREFLKYFGNILEEVKNVLSDISKVFDNDWHKGLNCNLKQTTFLVNFYALFLFLSNGKQKNLLNSLGPMFMLEFLPETRYT